MGAIFALAIPKILEHEGGYTVDHAGPTNFGITLPVLKDAALDIDHDGDIDADDIRAMREEHAIEVYRRCWWDRYEYGRIEDQDVATKVFDLAVNMGPKQAHKIAQRACRAAGWELVEDGIIGPKTLAALNRLNPSMVLAAMRSEAAAVYRMIIYKHPAYAKYEKGWLRRAYD